MRKLNTLVAVGLATVLAPSLAQAYDQTGAQWCTTSPATVNTPAGAVMLNSSAGPIKSVLSAVGEARSHSMIYHGNGWITHATGATPSENSWPDVCSLPAKPAELQNMQPGASQINMGALYAFYYGGGSQDFIYYQQGNGDSANRGNSIQSWLWSSVPYAWTTSQGNGAQGYYRISTSNGGGSWTQYGFYQYRDSQGVTYGNTDWGNDYDYGIVCSTLLAYAQARSGFAWGVPKYTYNHTLAVAGLNAVYNSINDECSNGWGFGKAFMSTFGCLDFSLCDEAGDQVSNCFADGIHGSCYSSNSSTWHSIRDNGATVSTSISPDAIGGWSGHPWGTANPNPVWSYDGNNGVSWSSAGSVYGCWF